MSLKKDRFSSFDKNNMRFAINLAINQNGLTGTNPSVGCVIVKNKKIISQIKLQVPTFKKKNLPEYLKKTPIQSPGSRRL